MKYEINGGKVVVSPWDDAPFDDKKTAEQALTDSRIFLDSSVILKQVAGILDQACVEILKGKSVQLVLQEFRKTLRSKL